MTRCAQVRKVEGDDWFDGCDTEAASRGGREEIGIVRQW
jgi:hypothetical protein